MYAKYEASIPCSYRETDLVQELNIFSNGSEPLNIGQRQIRFTDFCLSSVDVSVCQV